MDKLSELSKPVAWEVKGILCHSEEEARVYVGEPEPLYSQEYVSALLERIAELEAIRAAAEKLVRCKGRYHSEQNYRALAALFGVTTPDLPPVEGDSEAVIAELRAKLATPVRLPGSFYPDGDIDLPLVVELDEAVEAIRAAGFKIEGED
ncbi:EaD family phage protein [Serratia marcescens]|nr:hypothetical protein [Serratia marcescens]OJH82255.1 EaD family phage protein [Serratia marcescens]